MKAFEQVDLNKLVTHLQGITLTIGPRIDHIQTIIQEVAAKVEETITKGFSQAPKPLNQLKDRRNRTLKHQ